MEKRIILELTETECNQIGTLFQVAIQAQGIPAARVAMPLVDKISAALQSAIEPATSLVTLPKKG